MTYIAQIVYRILVDGVSTEQYEMQWRLILADDERQALTKARRIGMREESTFANRHGQTVCWKLVAIKELQPIELEHGGLLWSSITECKPIVSPDWYSAETLVAQA